MSDVITTNELTQEFLKENLSYDPTTGIFTRLKALKKSQVGKPAGTVLPLGYVSIGLGGKVYYAHRLAWFYVYGVWPADQIDHVNRDKADNRFLNLREATRSINNANVGVSKNNKLGYLGVIKLRNGNFSAKIMKDKKSYYLGTFKTAADAAESYELARWALR